MGKRWTQRRRFRSSSNKINLRRNKLTMHTKLTLKRSLIEFLKNSYDSFKENQSHELWVASKEWAFHNNYIIGGSYRSYSNHISLNLLIENKRYNFGINIHEVNTGVIDHDADSILLNH